MQRDCEHCGAKIELRLDMPYQKGWNSCVGCRIKSHCDTSGDCWIWQGARRGNYGVVRVREGGEFALRNAHRAAYAVWRGEAPNGLSVLHTCRQHLCCNPEHLYLKEQPLVLEASQLNYEAAV